MKFPSILALGAILVLGQLELTSAAACTAPGQVSGLSLREDEDSHNLHVTWTAPAGTSGCELHYIVTYTNNAQPPASESFTTSEPFYVIDKAMLVPCSTATITVTPVGATDGTISTVSAVLDTRSTTHPILLEMTTSCDSIQMKWEAEPYWNNMCELTHFQLICTSDSHKFTVRSEVTDVMDRIFEITLSAVLRPDLFYTCYGHLYVTLAGFSPESLPVTFWSNLDMVRDLTLVQNNDELTASWIPPLNSDQCGVGYYVTYENSVQGSDTVETKSLSYTFPFAVIPCTEYKVSVTPISFTGSSGTLVSEIYEPVVTVETVKDLQVDDNGNSLVLSWSAVDIGRCAIRFLVEHYVDGELQESKEVTTASASFTRIPCSENLFSVSVVTPGNVGAPVTFQFSLSGDIAEISVVRNIRVSGNVVTWDPPTSIGTCHLSYIVEHTGPRGTVDFTTPTTEATLTLVPCASNTVNVKGFSGPLEGPNAEHSFTSAAADFQAPENLQTIPALTSAVISMGAELADANSCPINQAIVSCSNDGGDDFVRNIPVSDHADRVFSLALDGLQQDTIYTCFVKWDTSPNSLPIKFRTIAIPNKNLSVDGVNKNGFNVKWTEDYGSQFVSDYQLVIQSNGPAHSVRDGCEVEGSGTFTFNFASGVSNGAFVDGFPHFGYSVVLITTYNLGSLGVKDTSASLPVETLTSDPGGVEDLTVVFRQTGGDGYNVIGEISWLPPCELNGALSGFGVTVKASFQFGSTEQNIEYSASLAAISPNNRYVYELTDIHPLFSYVVTINTVAASEGPGESIVLTPPGVCSCI